MLSTIAKELIIKKLGKNSNFGCLEMKNKNCDEIYEKIKENFKIESEEEDEEEKSVLLDNKETKILKKEKIKLISFKDYDVYILFVEKTDYSNVSKTKYLCYLIYNENSIKNTIQFIKKLMESNIIDIMKDKTEKINLNN